MKDLVSAALAPVGRTWRFAETHVWRSVAVLTAIALVTWQLGKPMWTLAPVFLISVLLMRADAVMAQRKP